MLQQDRAIIQAKPLTFNQTMFPEGVFEIFANQNWAMWLDSCNSVHIDSRFDIIVWQPEITLVTEENTTTITYLTNNESETSIDDPLVLLSKVQNKFFSNKQVANNALPFLTGALGYFSYDLGRRFEKLPKQAIKDINIPEMAIGIYNKAIIFDNHNKQFSLVCPENNRHSIEAQLRDKLQFAQQKSRPEKKITFQLTNEWQSNLTQQAYNEKFKAIQEYLLSGDCYQINLTQRFSANYTGNEFSAYKKLRHENQAPFSAFIKLPNCTILSISPERFLLLDKNKVQSKPIKGTKPRDLNHTIDNENARLLSESEKDRAENLMIVDLLRNDISKVCLPGSVKVPKLFEIESFPAIHHLVSTVEGILEEQYNACDLLRASFPGGSITGAPKIRAMEIIDELEPHRRSIYCGSIGYISACGNMDTSITIRTLVCEQNKDKNTIHCWAGGGIVADSTAEAEYQESFDKVNKILPILSTL